MSANASNHVVVIKQGREKPIIQRHPWVFSRAIDRIESGKIPGGSIVTLVSQQGEFLARGYWNARSQIQVRILTWQDEPINGAWWERAMRTALAARANYHHQEGGEGYRVINAENDYLPGLIVDRYGDWLVIQALTLHIDQQKQTLAAQLVDVFAELGVTIQGVYERSDVEVRLKEGLQKASGVLWGEAPPALIMLGAGNCRYGVDVRNGHKTGTYLDQKRNHAILAELCQSPDLHLLNLFSYTGRFGLGLSGKVTNVDASLEALELAERNYQLSGTDNAEFIQADVFDYLRDMSAAGEQYDVVVLDPPKFAHSQQQVTKAARGYKDINLHAFKVIKSGGYLLTFSCSGAIDRDLFQKIVFGALADSGRQAQIVQTLGAADDHPVALTFPEGEYLKGLLLRVL